MKKVILIGQQGCGSNLLRSFLNSHPDVFLDGELFVFDKFIKGATSNFYQSGKKVNGFLNGFFGIPKQGVRGFDLKYNQYLPEVIDYIRNYDVGVIHLIRNPGRTFLRKINEVHQKENISFSYSQVREHCDSVDNHIKNTRDLFSKGDYLELHYEDMTRGQEIENLPVSFEKRLLKWLEVDYYRLFIDDEYSAKSLKVRY